jgi:hypothetical protein
VGGVGGKSGGILMRWIWCGGDWLAKGMLVVKAFIEGVNEWGAFNE